MKTQTWFPIHNYIAMLQNSTVINQMFSNFAVRCGIHYTLSFGIYLKGEINEWEWESSNKKIYAKEWLILWIPLFQTWL